MPDKLDLTGDIASAVNTAFSRGRPLVLGYVDKTGNAAVSLRGSTHVHSDTQLAIWVRKPNDGFAGAIAIHPRVALLYYSPDGPGPVYVTVDGEAHVEPALNDAVYSNIPERERARDPDRKGVAVIIDVNSLTAHGPNITIEMRRED